MSIIKRIQVALLALLLAAAVQAQKPIQLKTAQDSASYAYGVVMSNSLKRQITADISTEMLLAGLRAALMGEPTLISNDDANRVYSNYSRMAQAKQAEAARAEGAKFLAENKKRKEVKTTESGLQYEVLKKGPGGRSPKETDKVEVHYHGTLINGEVFDSSVDRGQKASFGLNQVIKGWTEGLQYMQVGDKFKFYIPAELAYGDRSPSPKIKPGSTLIFEVELFNILD
ncbi:MAG: FKBP-type peptidyl-prolyl cis-trans isomerase [Saprospiraceae bacterium]